VAAPRAVAVTRCAYCFFFFFVIFIITIVILSLILSSFIVYVFISVRLSVLALTCAVRATFAAFTALALPIRLFWAA
jgi:hypothetical protein